MRWTYFSFAATFCLGITLLVCVPYRALTPGILRDGHQAQKNDCFSCHTLLSGAPTAKCSRCHKPGEIGLRQVNGEPRPQINAKAKLIHGSRSGECFQCHSEHGVRDGSKGTRRFSHQLLPAELAAGCTACHSAQRPADTIHQAVPAECSQCHGTKGWKPATYDHNRSFRFDEHHPPKCTDCHVSASWKEYSCTTCHEHALTKMESKHRKEGITNFELCRRCHPSGNEHDTLGRGTSRGEGRRSDERD